jgi:hypothetical protein
VIFGTNIQINRENETDTIYDAASEFRFNQRKTWVKGEFIHARLEDTRTSSHEGYFVAGGTRLDFLHENLDHMELVARYDRVEVNDSLKTTHDKKATTVGFNFFFDPEHKHDAKLQVNYIFGDNNGPMKVLDNSLQVQFVLGF